MSLPSLRLKANADRRLRAGHLWVYSNEIDVAATPLHGFKAGDQAILEAAGGKPLGIVALSPNNLICARLLSRDAKLPLDKSLLVHRLNVALSLRHRRSTKTPLHEIPTDSWVPPVEEQATCGADLVVDYCGHLSLDGTELSSHPFRFGLC